VSPPLVFQRPLQRVYRRLFDRLRCSFPSAESKAVEEESTSASSSASIDGVKTMDTSLKGAESPKEPTVPVEEVEPVSFFKLMR